MGRLIERQAELAAIHRLLDGSGSGRGGAVVVLGLAGIGKTALLAAAQQSATERGMRVLLARGSELERDYPFGVARQFLDSLVLADESGHAELFTGAAELARPLLAGSGSVPPEPGADPGFALLHGLYWLIANVARDRALVLLVDDAHAADTGSTRFLHFLARRLADLPAALVLATRPANLEALAHLQREPHVHTLRPAPLSPDGVKLLLRDALGWVDEEVGAAAHASTGGNPFFASEILRHLRATRPEARSGISRASPGRLELGKALLDIGVETADRRIMCEALEHAEACGSESLAELARTALVAAGGRPRRRAATGIDALTASERRIAERAATDRSNREIAQDLFVTEKTVEKHLSNVYRKLGISSRALLAGALKLL